MITISRTFSIDGVLTDMTSVVLSDPESAFGIKRNDTGEIIAADGTAMTKTATGTYEYSFSEPESNLTYTYSMEVVYAGETYYFTDTFTYAVATAGITTDIEPILTEWGETLTIKRSAKVYGASGIAVQTWATVSTFTGHWQPGDGKAIEVEVGRKVVYTAKIIAEPDIAVLEGDKIYRADGTFEYVAYVKRYRGHITIYTEKTRGAA